MLAAAGRRRDRHAPGGRYPLPIVTSLEGSAQHLYENVYCQRGQMENLIKLHKAQLSSDRISCHSATANQVRLVLHTAAFWLMPPCARRSLGQAPRQRRVRDDTREPHQDRCARHQTVYVARIRIHLPTSCPEASPIPSRRTRSEAIGPVSRRAECPTSRRPRQINPNASHGECNHTDRAERTTGARSINSPEKRARRALLRLDYWRLCDELTVLQAAMLIAGLDPADELKLDHLDWDQNIVGLDAATNAIANALRKNAIKGKVFFRHGNDSNVKPESAQAEFIDFKNSRVEVDLLKAWLLGRGLKIGFSLPRGQRPSRLS